jgi:polyferredoxin
MEKINKPKNLIGYTTERKLAGEPRRPVGARLYVYTIIIFCLTSIGAWGLYNRSSFDIELMRAGAAKFTKVDGKIQNHLQFRIENKTFAPMNLFIKSPNGSLTLIVPQNGAEISPSHELQIEVITQTMPELFSQGIAHQQILFENNLGENKTMNITLFGPER